MVEIPVVIVMGKSTISEKIEGAAGQKQIRRYESVALPVYGRGPKNAKIEFLFGRWEKKRERSSPFRTARGQNTAGG